MAFPTTSVLDDFNRADGPPGANWTSPVYLDSGLFEIVSNTATPVTGLKGGYWNPSTFGPGDEVFMDIPTRGSSTISIFIDIDPIPQNGYRLACTVTPTQQILRIDGGSETQIGATQTVAIASGDSIGISHESGGAIEAWVKQGSWSSLTSGSDTTYSSGRIGLMGFGVTQFYDNFGGGNISAPPPSGAPTLRVVQSGLRW